MLVKDFGRTASGVTISILDMVRLTGLSERSHKQYIHRFINGWTNAVTDQTSLYNVDSNNMVGELSLVGSLHSIKVALPTILVHPLKLSLCGDRVFYVFKHFKCKPMVSRLISQSMEASESAPASSFHEFTSSSFSNCRDPGRVPLFKTPGFALGHTQKQKVRKHQKLSFIIPVVCYDLQEFCKLDDYGLKTEKTVVTSQEFSKVTYGSILKFRLDLASMEDSAAIGNLNEVAQYCHLDKTG